jgi:glycosyltransferase involved in cell wall biosynthesis
MTSRVLLVCDRPNWTYSTKAGELVKHYRGEDLALSIITTKDRVQDQRDAFDNHDYYLFFGFQNVSLTRRRFRDLDPKKILVSIASHQSWDREATQPDNQILPYPDIVDYLKTFRSVGAVSYRLQMLFRMVGMKNTAYTPNGVPLDKFSPPYLDFSNPNGKLICGYAGRDVDQKKGNRSIIEPALENRSKGFVLKQALCNFRLERKTGTRGDCYLPYEEMPAFYRDIDIYICASREEGSCRSVLEAMACGCVIISTDCGAINELVINGYNGLIIDRSPKSLMRALTYLRKNKHLIPKMKERSREIVSRYDWQNVVSHWYEWIMGAILNPEV